MKIKCIFNLFQCSEKEKMARHSNLESFTLNILGKKLKAIYVKSFEIKFDNIIMKIKSRSTAIICICPLIRNTDKYLRLVMGRALTDTWTDRRTDATKYIISLLRGRQLIKLWDL